MRVIICGDRFWPRSKRPYIVAAMAILPPDSVIIEGEDGSIGDDGKVVIGVDKMAREIGEEMGLKVIPFHADWTRKHRSAGPQRNTQMLKEGKPDIVWAFHPNLSHSKGTANMIFQAITAEVPVIHFTGKGDPNEQERFIIGG